MVMCTIGGITGGATPNKCNFITSAIVKEDMHASTSKKHRQLSVELAWVSR